MLSNCIKSIKLQKVEAFSITSVKYYSTQEKNVQSFSSVLSKCISMVSPNKDVVTSASKLINPLSSPFSPLSVVSNEMETLTKNISKLIGSGHPVLNRISGYYFEQEGKKVRPLLVLLLSKALAEIPLKERNQVAIDRHDIPGDPVYEESARSNKSLFANPVASFSPLSILHGIKQATSPLTKGSEPLEESVKSMDTDNGILPKQRRLAEIVEMIHTASLLHDDVIDFSDTRRGRPSGNIQFSNKMAVLAGDFLLGRSVVAISRLRNQEVIELVSNCIANLVEGEFMQLKNTVIDQNQLTILTGDTKNLMPLPTGKELEIGHAYTIPAVSDTSALDKLNHDTLIKLAFDHYLHKTYLKTASLISKSLRSTAILSGCNEVTVENCYEFGKNIGICFQLVDDMLDFTVSAKELGKPSGADLKLGISTAPVLYAWKEDPSLGPLIQRHFSQQGDIQQVLKSVELHDGVGRTKKLAENYRDMALKCLRDVLPESDSRSALEFLTNSILTRRK